MSSLLTIAAALPFPITQRWRLLSLFGLEQNPVGFERGVRFWNAHVSIGRDSYVNRAVVFEGSERIRIGTHVAIGPEVMILTSTHRLGPHDWRAGGGAVVSAPVSIGDGTWIGARTTILPGVTIGSGCVIAAGSVVVEDCPDDTMWAGVPAAQKKHL